MTSKLDPNDIDLLVECKEDEEKMAKLREGKNVFEIINNVNLSSPEYHLKKYLRSNKKKINIQFTGDIHSDVFFNNYLKATQPYVQIWGERISSKEVLTHYEANPVEKGKGRWRPLYHEFEIFITSSDLILIDMFLYHKLLIVEKLVIEEKSEVFKEWYKSYGRFMFEQDMDQLKHLPQCDTLIFLREKDIQSSDGFISTLLKPECQGLCIVTGYTRKHPIIYILLKKSENDFIITEQRINEYKSLFDELTQKDIEKRLGNEFIGKH